MVKLILILTLLSPFVSSLSQTNKFESKTGKINVEKLGSGFLDDLYNRRHERCIGRMDDTVIAVAEGINPDSALVELSDKLRSDYGTEITSALISPQKTFNEILPATFLIFKVESPRKFGYCYFYISDKSHKIFLV